MIRQTSLLGASAIALAIAFNIPFSILGSIFDYPDILRQPSAEVLNRFHAGGSALVFTWYGFMACAVLMVLFSIWLSGSLPSLANRPGLARLALVAGSLAGILQAIGLSRWVFVVPLLASHHADPDATPVDNIIQERIFETLNLWGGVAIGEHLGQIFTILFVAAVAISQTRASNRFARLTGWAGCISAAAIAIGLSEGIAIALLKDGSAFSMATVLGYSGFSLWLVLTGFDLLRNPDAIPHVAGGYSRSTM